MQMVTQIRIQAAAILLAVAGIEAVGQAGRNRVEPVNETGMVSPALANGEQKPAVSDSVPAVSATATVAIVPVSPAGRVIVVSLEDRRMALVEDGAVKKIYTVAVGKPSTPSPVGSFTIESRVANPTYSHAGKIVPPGPGNPVGTRWMGLSVRGYGIHGTNAPNSIGKAASHGCIRMGKADLEELFTMVRPGDTVRIVGERNAETAQLFGMPATAPLAATQLAAVTVSAHRETAQPAGAINIATGDVPAVLPAR